MKKKQKKWELFEDVYLIENYGKIKTREIAENLKRSYSSVKSRAHKKLNLKFEFIGDQKIESLLTNNNINWYWYGFIIGDGNFSDKYLRITVHKKDKEHLNSLCESLNIKLNENKEYVTLCVRDSHNVPILKDKLGVLSDNKTKTPPLLVNILDEFKIQYIIGLIDADGYIEQHNGKGRFIRIELDSSWYENLIIISEWLKKILNIDSKVFLNSRGYASFRLCGHKNILKLKGKINDYHLPYLKRKWDGLSDNIEKTWFFHEIKDKVFELYNQGYNLHHISKLLDVKYNSLYNHKNEIINNAIK